MATLHIKRVNLSSRRVEVENFAWRLKADLDSVKGFLGGRDFLSAALVADNGAELVKVTPSRYPSPSCNFKRINENLPVVRLVKEYKK